MQHRTNLFVMFATCVALCAQTGTSVTALKSMYYTMPGGFEGVPGFTRAVLGPLNWLASWWPICLLFGAIVAFGGPPLLRRSDGGQKFLLAADGWLTRYHGSVVVVFVAAMFWIFRAIDHALWLPVTQMIERLTGG